MTKFKNNPYTDNAENFIALMLDYYTYGSHSFCKYDDEMERYTIARELWRIRRMEATGT